MFEARIATAQTAVAIAFHTVPALGEMTAYCEILELGGREDCAFVVSIEVFEKITIISTPGLAHITPSRLVFANNN